jgi:hypothetical protein
VTTHLEAFDPPTADAQMKQLMAGPLASKRRQSILVGDFNSAPSANANDRGTSRDASAYYTAIDAGFRNPLPKRATCCFAEDLHSTADSLDTWIDHVVVRPRIRSLRSGHRRHAADRRDLPVRPRRHLVDAAPAVIRLALAAAVAALLCAAPVAAAAPAIHAHRGGPFVAGKATYAEETLPAFRAAARRGFVLELDTRVTQDGVVALHDATLERTTPCTGRAAETTLAAIAACRSDIVGSPAASSAGAAVRAGRPRRRWLTCSRWPGARARPSTSSSTTSTRGARPRTASST